MKKISFENSVAFIFAIILAIMAFLEYCCSGFALASLFGALKDIAGTGVVVVIYLAAVKSLKENSRKNHDKLKHLDELEKIKRELNNATDISSYYKTVFYGMQALIYNGEFDNLLKKVVKTIERPALGKECKAVLLCVRDVLSFFKETENFTKGLPYDKYQEYIAWLAPDNREWLEHLKHIKDKDLAAWCNIQRADTLELIIENRIKRVCKDETLLKTALAQSFKLIDLLDRQVENTPDDKYYALLYRSYVNRNISFLYEISGDMEKCAVYSYETLQNRKELFEHYETVRSYSDVMEDHIAHEYLLALVEYYSVEQDEDGKADLRKTSHDLYDNWKNKIGLQQKIFEKVELKIKEIDETPTPHRAVFP